MLRHTLAAVAFLGTWVALVDACPCCPTCMPVYCPCACETCGDVPGVPPQNQTPVVNPSVELEVPPKPIPGPLLECALNCFGDGATPVPLPGGNGNGVPAESKAVCRDICSEVEGCEAYVYGQGMCWGKKDVQTSKCQPSGDFQTDIITALPFGTCTVMGDPHVLSFDNPNGLMGDITQLDSGEYWLVKSESLQIQGRFGYSERFRSEASATGISVSGPLVQNKKLTVVYTGPAKGQPGFKAFWEGAEILNVGFPANFDSPDGVLKARLANMNPQDFHSQARHTIGGIEGDLPSYLFELVPNIHIYLLLGEDTLNAVIKLRRPSGEMDGYCGNFNCDPADDTLDQVTARGLGKAIGGSLFVGAPPPPASQTVRGGKITDINDCAPELMTRAEEACKDAGPQTKTACMFDVCASGSTEAAAMDVVTSAVEKDVTQHFELFGVKFPHLFGGSIAAPVQAGFAAIGLAVLFASTTVGWSSRRRDSLLGDGRVPASARGDASDEEALLLPTASEFDPIHG